MREVIDIRTETRRLPDGGRQAYIWSVTAAGVGLLGAGLALLQPGGSSRLLWSYLVSYVFFLSLALGALFFVLLQHLTHAGWSVVVRRLAEAVAANLPLLAVLALPVIFGARALYPWADAAAMAADPTLAKKTVYLNLPFFVVRLVIYFAVWAWCGRSYFRRSVSQDESGDEKETRTLERWAPAATVVYALTTTFAAFDLLMSLEPRWFSTIFGVYFFAGAFVGFLALLAVVALVVQNAGCLTRAVTAEHYHDIGKLLFAFVIFWAYIGFSQFMLIWYGNMPEETNWFRPRVAGAWGVVAAVLLFGHFFLPFFGLLGRRAKRTTAVLVLFAVWLLAMHYLDLYWVVMPEMRAAGGWTQRLADASVLLMLGGALTAVTARRMARCSLVPEGDPRLAESLAFENV